MEISFARHQFPPDIIRHAVWLYLRFTLSFRDIEDLLAERGLDVSYETVRRWVLKFGRCCHTNLIPVARCLEGPLRFRPRWRLATSGTLRLSGREACGGM
jgi:putative transposase